MSILVDPQKLPGTLTVPEGVSGVIVFAHGSGSSRFSPRNQLVARHLHANGFATFLFDLLHESEANDREKVFDIELLSNRLLEAIECVTTQVQTSGLSIGLFGASTGSAAALTAAARSGDRISAVVSRGGRPDLAENLALVRAPTLLIVGAEDHGVLNLNREALQQLQCEAELVIVPRATHLFSEPGTLEQVAHLASNWFMAHLQSE